MNYQTLNICTLGICFSVLAAGWVTLTDLQKALLISAHDDNPNFDVDGYTYLGAFFSSFAISLWFAPSAISLFGPRMTMFVGALTHIAPPAAILLEDSWLLYSAGFLNGIGASFVWTASATYLVLSSTKETLADNTSLFWLFYPSGPIIANIFLYFAFRNATVRIDKATRHLVLFGFIGVHAVGALLFLLLRREVKEEDEKQVNDSPLQAFKKAWSIARSKNIAILLAAFIYCGLHVTLISGVYGSSIGFTLQLGEGVKKLIPLSSMLVGCGEVFGGMLIKVFGNIKINRINFFFVFAIMGNFMCYLIVFLSLPANANFGNTHDKGIIEPRLWLLLMTSFFFGMGDSLVHIQLYTLVGSLYPRDSAPAFSVFKFIRGASVSASFYYSPYLLLPTQLVILCCLGFLAAILFNVMHYINERNQPIFKL